MTVLKFVMLLCLSLNCYAAVEYKKFENPEQEQAYKVLIEEIRCLVCQNQTIADSNADLAKDLRRQIYEMLQQGKSREQIALFMTERYGDFVLYNPPFKAKTGVLWLGPIIFLILGLTSLIFLARKKSARKAVENENMTNDAPETVEKKAKIKALLENGDES